MDASDHQPKYSCLQCEKQYRRPEHLKRHQASHLSSVRPHRCALCQASFQRSDLLRRHERTCTGTTLKSGSSRRACDQCVRSKKACNSLQPCLHCQRRQRDCTYGSSGHGSETNRTARSYAHAKDPILEQDSTALGYMDLLAGDIQQPLCTTSDTIPSPLLYGSGELCVESISNGQRRVALQFLERFTRNEGLVASFDCCSEAERTAVRKRFGTLQIFSLRDSNDPMTVQCGEIITLLKEVVSMKPRNSAVTQSWSAAVADECASFFYPGNMYIFLELYWAIWSPNIPFLHRPTFNVRSTKPTLLAAMAIIGASVSSDEKDRSRAEVWFNCVEEAVFRDEDFCHCLVQEPAFPSKSRIQALQASYVVCLFQNWQGTDSSRRRIRSFGYSTVVAVGSPSKVDTRTAHIFAGSSRHWHGPCETPNVQSEAFPILRLAQVRYARRTYSDLSMDISP